MSVQEAFREALRAEDFDSVRGAFAFASNHHPIHSIYAREVVEIDGTLTNRIIGTAYDENYRDIHGADCSM